jgi:hypothetical protein
MIERYDNITFNDLKDLIDGLGWFAASEIDAGTFIWYADEEKQKYVMRIDSAELRFSSTGNVNDSARYIYGRYDKNGYPRYAFKTKNGLLLSNTTSYANSNWTPWAGIIGKTNNGDIAVAINVGNDMTNIGKIATSAYGETAKGLESLSFRASYNYPLQREQTCQITGMPIPTCPSNGTSYIKGALALVVAPWSYYCGEVDINGVRYVTNGYLALNDED